jgi:single-strand DNA-binding protein
MNALTITGNLGDDPELRFGANGRPFASLRVANNEYVNGETIENGWFDVTVFGPQAERVAESLKKGDRVLVSGRLNESKFETQYGTTGSRVRITALAVAASLEFSDVSINRTPRAAAAADASADTPVESAETPEKVEVPA